MKHSRDILSRYHQFELFISTAKDPKTRDNNIYQYDSTNLYKIAYS